MPSDVEAESDRLRERAERRRQRVLADQQRRMEKVGGTCGDGVSQTPGAARVESTNSRPSATESWSTVLQAFFFLSIFPIALVSAIIELRDARKCWAPETLSEGMLLRLASNAAKVSGPVLFTSMEALNVALVFLVSRPITPAGGLLRSLGVSPAFKAMGDAVIQAYSVGVVMLQIGRDFCLYLVCWKLLSILFQAIY
eukprot:Gregarina_sp_Poly_1__6397@NODE_340_length_9432_cov_376_033743_g285_i0_p5_GENE_NODE_340_length_9432_cov_376_033743_g285_i0NODE_340_length_9432_cov_376_033743_g285_i0_p5_ORF_typecomplete_len198_score30_68CAML/PF14963_6/0_076CAML/PF14963_6/1_8e03Phage_lysis/PF03245_13/1_9GET2/PF08690_10/4GET2/PF08690_10/4_9e02_NODE_340_length_9432_cov_376_033743_g285_i024853078